jgi:energy-coupling factor transporter ATP-binding protein EcfA2
MKRIRLSLAPNLEVEFADRERALQQVLEWSERGTRFPIVVFGPEGCGKTAWLKQATEILRERGYHVVYVNPLQKEFLAHTDVREVAGRFAEIAAKASGRVEVELAYAAFNAARELVRLRRKNVAVLVDDAFQVLGSEKEAAFYVKSLLGLIEYPPESYEKIVAVAATSEGLSRREIGRHLWAEILPMWNMPRKGFEELYEQVPGPKPDFEEVWRLTGGNPRVLAQLYEAKWQPEKVVETLAEKKRLTLFAGSLSPEEREWLRQAVEDPDTLFARERIPLMEKLIELNLIVDSVPRRESWLWVDEPPPEKEPDLGIGRRVAWQSPLHREAVRRALKELA